MKVDVLGVKINTETKEEILALLKTGLNSSKSIFIVTPYSESIVAAQKDEEFRRVLNSADIALPDGVGILWAAHYLKSKNWNLFLSLARIIYSPESIRDPIPEKISGAEFVWDLAKLAAENDYSIFLLGGFGDTPQRAAAALKVRFPNLEIAGTSNNEGDCFASLAMTKPDLLFVALGPVRQEKWIARHLPDLPVKLVIGVGGTFDYLARKRPYRPDFWALRGLEWLWRLLAQPWRAVRVFRGIFGLIWYSVKNKN